MNGSTPQPGWYDDPHGRFEFRYHNGQRWTADVASGGERFVDPTGQPVMPLERPAAARVPPVESRPPGNAAGVVAVSVAVGSLLVAWVPFLFAVAAAGSIVAFVFGLRGLRVSRASSGLGRRTSVAGLVIAPIALLLCIVGLLLTMSVIRIVNLYLEPGPHELIADQPCAVVGTSVTFTGTIRNLDDTSRGYTITVEFLDGTRVADRATVKVDDVAPQQQATWQAIGSVSGSVSGTSVTCRVRTVHGPAPFGLPMG